MRKLHLLISLFVYVSSFAQTNGNVYGIIRKNYYSIVTDPFDSTITFQQFDSCTIKFGECNPVTGLVTTIGNTQYSQSINLTGAALNPYNNTYIFQTGNNISSFNINTGLITNQVPVTNPNGPSYFDNFRFNNSDSSIYGLARRTYFDTASNAFQQGVFLATANQQTGVISELSSTAIAPGFALLGSAIDPYQMLYYFSTGNNLLAIDMYTGAVYNNATLTITDGFSFGNFTYSCVDTAIYGLVRQNYFSNVPDPFNPGGTMQVLDSSTLKLGRVNPSTGVVTNISTHSIGINAYTINGGAAIDPTNMIYYFSYGSGIAGVSMTTGQIVSTPNYQIANGDYFDLMRNFENCYSATRIRQNPTLTATENTIPKNEYAVYPNPNNGSFQIQNIEDNATITIYDLVGRIIHHQNARGNNISCTIEKPGVYYLRVSTPRNTATKTIIIQH